VSIDISGIAKAHGVAAFRTQDGSEVFSVDSEGASASCADRNGNRIAGLTGLEVELVDVRSGDTILAVILPDDGEIDESGWHPATIRLGDTTVAGMIGLQNPLWGDK
jgi:hypothetical protein